MQRFEEALDLFKLPLNLGTYEGKEVIIGVGRFGPYIKLDDAFISIPRTIDPLSLDMDGAIEIIKEKQLADAPVAQYKGKGVTKGKGRFGPFIKYEGLFINVPRAYDFDNLSQSDINELIEKREGFYKFIKDLGFVLVSPTNNKGDWYKSKDDKMTRKDKEVNKFQRT